MKLSSRIVTSCWFLAGGLLTWFALWALRTLVSMEAGMSAGSVAGPLNRETVAMWLLCSYFVVSAVAAILFARKNTLRILGVLAHSLVVIAFCLFVSESTDENTGKTIANAITLAGIMGVYFAPWVCLWFFRLLRETPKQTGN